MEDTNFYQIVNLYSVISTLAFCIDTPFDKVIHALVSHDLITEEEYQALIYYRDQTHEAKHT